MILSYKTSPKIFGIFLSLHNIIMEQYVPSQVFWNKKFYYIYMNIFGKRLNELRQEEKITRMELAKRLNVSVRLISYWENGERECSFDTLIQLADLLNTTTDYLLGRTEY